MEYELTTGDGLAYILDHPEIRKELIGVKYLCFENGMRIAVDNSTGDMFVEEFHTKIRAIKRLSNSK